MKKIFFILSFATILSCSSSDDSSTNNDNTTPPNNYNTTSSLSEYESAECADFVKFNVTGNFLNFLISRGYDLNNDSKISCYEASLITELNLGSSAFVRDFKGIEQLINLKTITGCVYLWNGDITNAGTLNLYNNKKLETINFNVGWVVGNGQTKGYIGKLVLPKSNTLKTLNSPENTVANLLNTAMQSNLEILNLRDSDLGGALDLSGCNKLTTIDLTSNRLTSIKFSNFTNPYLQTLKIGRISINDQWNELSTITLTTFPNLEWLDVSGNRFTTIDISQNTKLKWIDLRYNQLLNLNVSNNNLIETLIATNNKISIFNASNLTNLQNIYLDNNILVTLNLQNGKNKSINYMQTQQNKELKCIKIDNGFTPTSKNWIKDSQTSYCN
jgi:hypothetical protein